MGTKFTKGEWKINDINIVAENGETICQVYDGFPTHISKMNMEIVEANAKLIAAAPEMIKLLVKISNSQVDGSYILAADWWKELKETIKKATE
jgi:hypothetical protein